jgi:hypothetical protein
MMMRMLAMLMVIVLMVLVRVLEVWIAHDPGIVPEIAVSIGDDLARPRLLQRVLGAIASARPNVYQLK